MEHKKSNYNCEQCDFHTNANSAWIKHIETELHKTGKRKTRSDKKIVNTCDKCGYKSTSNSSLNIRQHILNMHSTIEERIEKFKYYCKKCDYGCFSKPHFENHISTNKHKCKTEKIDKIIKNY